MPKIFEYLGILVFFYSNILMSMNLCMFMVNMPDLKVRLNFIL